MEIDADYSEIKFVLNFFIKAKSECVDKFVLFDRNSARFIEKIAHQYEDYIFSSEENSRVRLRVFQFDIDHSMEIFIDMKARLLLLIDSYPDLLSYFRQLFASGDVEDCVRAYFSPYRIQNDQSKALVEEIKNKIHGL